jgi:hypothetical protein
MQALFCWLKEQGLQNQREHMALPKIKVFMPNMKWNSTWARDMLCVQSRKPQGDSRQQTEQNQNHLER